MKRFTAILFVIIFLLLISSTQVFAQVVINEVSPASDPEWVEIYNNSSDSASLKNYSLNFGSDTQNKFFCDAENINGNAYKIISLSSHWLADSGDTVTLKNGDDAVDSIAYGSGHVLKSPISTGSISRLPDGTSNWILLTASTQQGDIVSFDCPTPTPTETPHPTQTPTLTLTPVPTPTRTPTPVPTRIPTPTPTKIPNPTKSPEENLSTASGNVLGLGDTFSNPISSPASNVMNKSTIFAFGLMGTGAIFIGLSVYLGIRSVKNSVKQNDI